MDGINPQDDIRKKLDALPVEIKNMLYSAETDAIAQQIGAKHRLHLDQTGLLIAEINEVMTGALAVAAGARMLEVHFCLSETSRDNSDRRVSHEPNELGAYIWLARLAARAMGDGRKRVMPSEEANVRYRYTA